MKNKVFISAYLKDDKNKDGEFYGRDVYKALHNIEELEIVEIQNHKKNVWCRDYMPVKRADGKLVQFTYKPGYMQGMIKYENSFPEPAEIAKELKEKGVAAEIISSQIVLDGGAIDVHGDQAIVSDRVFRDNQNMKPKDILNEIKTKLNLQKLVVIPQDPYDVFGHVDGLVRFIDYDRVLINDLSGLLKEIEIEKNREKSKNYYLIKLLEQWYYSFLMAFENVGLKVETIPCTAYGNQENKNEHGLYINFLKLDNLIVMPSFGQNEDEEAQKTLERLFQSDVKKISASKLATEGGLINCVTWDY